MPFSPDVDETIPWTSDTDPTTTSKSANVRPLMNKSPVPDPGAVDDWGGSTFWHPISAIEIRNEDIKTPLFIFPTNSKVLSVQNIWVNLCGR